MGSGAVDALGAPNSLPERVELAKQSALVIEPSATAYVEAPPLGTAAPAGALEDAHPTARARWTNRMGLEVAALGLAILGPPALAYGLSRAKEDVPLLPFASIASALLVLVLSAAIGGYAVVGLCGARVRYWVEASLTALLAFGFAMAWVWVAKHALPDSAADDAQLKALRRALGFGWSAVVVALVPALVEEIAFRGVLQGRTSALFGARAGWLVTALAFALCHFAPAVLPIHLGLGLYLGWLRTRSESLVPGMLLHALYNTLVLLADG
ncbi:MAG: CPBP family intramembrane glutamic endopeptidase [Planctomycetota bacterium]